MVLVLALLIIAAVLATAVIFSNLIIREIQQSRLIDQSIQAYYLAESGAERALHQTRRREAVQGEDCGVIISGSNCQENNGYCSSTNNEVSCITGTEGNLAVRSGWLVTVDNETETAVNLKVGESFQIDLFNPFKTAGPNIEAIEVNRDDPGIVLYGELTNFNKVLGVGPSNCQNQPPVLKDFLPNPSVRIRAFDDQDIAGECSYSFRVNYPLDSGLDPVAITLTVYDDFDQPLPIPSRLLIDSQADFGRSRQKVRVKTPIRPPLSGLYDFVIFSEEEIIKQ